MTKRITVADALAQVGQLTREGQYVAAEALCREVASLAPQQPEVWHLLSVLCLAQMKWSEAETSLVQAVALAPGEPRFWADLSVALRAQRRPIESEWYIRRAISLDSNAAVFWSNLGGVLADQRRFAEAASAYRQAIARGGQSVNASQNAWCGLAVCCFEMDSPVEAREAFETSLAIDPDCLEAQIRYATFLGRRGESAGALQILERVLSQTPQLSSGWCALATVHTAAGDMASAEAACRSALELEPQSIEARQQLAELLRLRWALPEAESCVRQILDAAPQSPEAWTQLGLIQHAMARPEEALASLRKGVAVWRDPLRHSKLLASAQYCEGFSAEELLAMHRAWEALYARSGESGGARSRSKKTDDGRLRVGFVAADFGSDLLRFLALPAIESLDRTKCLVVCYSDAPVEQSHAAGFRTTSDLWRLVRGLTSQELAELIRADEIDVLVDLMGHTGQRLLMFARKPAPVQVGWMGYGGTRGLTAMDFLIADKRLIGEGEESWYSEAVLRLPGSYACYKPPAYAPPATPLPALAAGRFTFGSLNSPQQFSAETLDAWAEILRRVSDSQLLLKHAGLDQPALQDRVRERFRRNGISTERILFEGQSSHEERLATYQRIDLALDTQPFSGDLTTCEALWMGVPVITYPGKTFAGRVSMSHMVRAGYPQFGAADRASYIDLAVQWSQRIDELAAVRVGIREQIAGLRVWDAKEFAAQFLDVLRQAWMQIAQRT